MAQNGIITTSGLPPGFPTNSVLRSSPPDLYALETPNTCSTPNTLCSHAFRLSFCLTDVGSYSSFRTAQSQLLCVAFSRLPTTIFKRSVFYAACVFVNSFTIECYTSLWWLLASFSVSGTTFKLSSLGSSLRMWELACPCSSKAQKWVVTVWGAALQYWGQAPSFGG